MGQHTYQAIRDRLEEGRLPCSAAHTIAEVLGITPPAVGLAANQAEIRISRCQLGLFGYGRKAEGKHKIVRAMEEVPERLASRLRAEAIEGGIRCADIWKVADELGYPRIEAASAVEAMDLRVSHCQLGCFPRPWRR